MRAGLAIGLLLAAWAGGVVAAECPAGQHEFAHELLVAPVCVPDRPQRVAFIDSNIAFAVALDIPSVTTSYYSGTIVKDFAGLKDRIGPDATDVGNTWEMSGEPLLLASPDLVVTSTYWEKANAFAKDIAPTVIIDPDRSKSWREIPALIAELFGKQAEQKALDDALATRIATFNTELGGKVPSFTFVQVESPTLLWVFTNKTFGPELALEAGLQFGPNVLTPEDASKVDQGGPFAYPVALERIDEIVADHIFIYSNINGVDARSMLLESEIGKRFVEAHTDQLHFLAGEYWFNASAFAAERVMDDLFRDVVGKEPAEVSPNPLAWSYAAVR